jgi:hypothetical protein
VVPIAWGLVQGERPSALAFLGAVITLSAAVVLARSEGAGEQVEVADDRRASVMAVGAGLAFGAILVCFSETSSDIGLWPPVVAHTIAIPTLTIVLLATGRLARPPAEARRVMVASGFSGQPGRPGRQPLPGGHRPAGDRRPEGAPPPPAGPGAGRGHRRHRAAGDRLIRPWR